MTETAQRQLEVRLKPGAGALYEIRLEGGGQVPELLSGVYNRKLVANKAISDYLSDKAYKQANKRSYNRSRKDAKAKDQSGD